MDGYAIVEVSKDWRIEGDLYIFVFKDATLCYDLVFWTPSGVWTTIDLQNEEQR